MNDQIQSKITIHKDNNSIIPLNISRDKENEKEDFISSLIKENLILKNKVNELLIQKSESLNNLVIPIKLKSMSKPKYKSKNLKVII